MTTQQNFLIYNTLSRSKELFKPLHAPNVGMYVCGPTVYGDPHLGHARPAITFDLLFRYLKHLGYKVRYVRNITDIDDKMIQRANREGITVQALGDRFIEEYYKDAGALGVEPADVHPRATEHIPQIIVIIQELIDKGMAR